MAAYKIFKHDQLNTWDQHFYIILQDQNIFETDLATQIQGMK